MQKIRTSLFALVCLGGLSCESDPVAELKCKSLLPGDLVISEVMSNPSGTDGGNEYIEIYNATLESISLESLRIGILQEGAPTSKSFTFGDSDIPSEGYLIIGDVAEAEKPEHVDVGYDSAIGSLRNDGGELGIFCGSTFIDTAGFPKSGDGKASVLDGSMPPDAVANDDVESFCDSDNEFNEDIIGSPGSANQRCGGVFTGSTCTDSGGTQRDLVPPLEGSIFITEIMPNPGGDVSDNDGEWFEITTTRPFDLNALQIGTTADELTELSLGEDCISIDEDEHVLFARNPNPDVNGGLPTVDAVFNIRLTNTSGNLFLGTGDSILDELSWQDAEQGVSFSLSGDTYDADSNDDFENFCSGAEAYGDGDLGTPGQANPACDAPPTGNTCLDNGTPRALRPPGVSDISIVEVMPNPTQVNDSDGEYIEVVVNNPIDLNGLQVGRTISPTPTPEYTFASDDCLAFERGERFLLVRNIDSTQNGGLPSDNIFDADISLPQTAGNTYTLYLGVEQTIFNSFQYNGSDVLPGQSLSVDDNGTICSSTDTYGDGDNGTPGLPNPLCP